MSNQQEKLREEIALHLANNEVEFAHSLSRKLQPRDSKDSEYYYLRAKLDESVGKLSEARRLYAEAIRVNPTYSPPFGALLRLHRLERRAFAWFSSAEQFYLLHPNDQDVVMEFAAVLVQIGKMKLASEIVKSVLSSDPAPKLGLQLLATRLGIPIFRKASTGKCECHSTMDDTEMPLDEALSLSKFIQERKYEQARSVCERLLNKGYRSPDLLLWAAEAFWFLRMYDDAEECVRSLPADVRASLSGQFFPIQTAILLRRGRLLPAVWLMMRGVLPVIPWVLMRIAWRVRGWFVGPQRPIEGQDCFK